MEEETKIIGFIFCHGPKDFSLWETDAISMEDQEKIWKILQKYDDTGSGERNVYDKIKDMVCENY